MIEHKVYFTSAYIHTKDPRRIQRWEEERKKIYMSESEMKEEKRARDRFFCLLYIRCALVDLHFVSYWTRTHIQPNALNRPRQQRSNPKLVCLCVRDRERYKTLFQKKMLVGSPSMSAALLLVCAHGMPQHRTNEARLKFIWFRCFTYSPIFHLFRKRKLESKIICCSLCVQDSQGCCFETNKI